MENEILRLKEDIEAAKRLIPLAISLTHPPKSIEQICITISLGRDAQEIEKWLIEIGENQL